jgi:Photosystem II Psb31 protein
LSAVDRRAVFGQIAAGAIAVVVAAPGMASADGAVSGATILKAKVKYGSRIAALKSAVASGDFAAVAAEKSAFILFNSGAYPGAKNKPDKKQAIDGTNAIFAAIRAGDKAALKTAYDSYISSNSITGAPIPAGGQSYASDFSYLTKTPSASIYLR